MIYTIFFTVIDSYQKKQKKNNNTGVGVEWDGIFPQFFRGIGTGRD